MRDATRRNRNIGTAKQGHGKDNELTIPQPALTLRSFFERLDNYNKIPRTINGHDFLFVVEQTRESSKHACTINDISKIIENIPTEDYGDLKLIILRQAKRKEETMSSVWGRLIYSYEFEGDYFPAIVIEAIDFDRKFKWTKKLSVDSQKELEKLKEDGHKIVDDKRHFVADYEIDNVRTTQLYRTLIHEFGHYVHYLEFVERPGTDDEEYEEWEKRYDLYFKLPKSEKEKFAHNYADKIKSELIEKKIIPFEKIEDE
ncbi:hypothetical protein [Saccharicrinis sp. FJH54]|uniref:hypothetical protein n=1 Tax=Saccharicrinis sp. FJH54 TaxID=3344665 RepID=UPI0035D410E3